MNDYTFLLWIISIFFFFHRIKFYGITMNFTLTDWRFWIFKRCHLDLLLWNDLLKGLKWFFFFFFSKKFLELLTDYFIQFNFFLLCVELLSFPGITFFSRELNIRAQSEFQNYISLISHFKIFFNTFVFFFFFFTNNTCSKISI